MISMTAYMKRNGFGCFLPELKREPTIEEFLVRNYGIISPQSHVDIILQNFRNFLKLFRKILRFLYLVDDSLLVIDLFQYCKFLYATLHVQNIPIKQRLVQNGVSFELLSRQSKYLKRYVMSASPFCVAIFISVHASKVVLDKCSFCQSDNSANVIGRCPQHNICCSECFPRAVKLWPNCPSCRNTDFLP
jgi:hypothetical protein